MFLKLFILLGTLFVFNLPSNGYSALILEHDSQRPGGDYTRFYTPTAQNCAEKCDRSSRCKAFDFHLSDRSCWLKNQAYPARPRAGVISGMKRRDYSGSTANVTAGWNLDYDTQRPGGDYTRFQAGNAQECSQYCDRDGRCVAFDYTTVDSYCYLKNWVPRARPYRGIISGVKNYPQVKRAQELLIQLHYNPGPADGLMGRKTQRALKHFQRDHYLPATGRIDDVTLKTLELSQSPPPSSLSPASGYNNGQHGGIDTVQSVEQTPAVPVSVSEPEQEAAQGGLLKDSLLYVKTVGVTYLQLEDNIYAKILAKIPAGTELQVLSDRGEWYKVSFQNQTGYILAESVTKERVSPDLPEG